MLLHQAVQGDLLGAVALVVDQGAIRRPVGLRTDGLHALLMSEPWCFTVSSRATCRHDPVWRLIAGAHLKVSTVSAGTGVPALPVPVFEAPATAREVAVHGTGTIADALERAAAKALTPHGARPTTTWCRRSCASPARARA